MEEISPNRNVSGGFCMTHLSPNKGHSSGKKNRIDILLLLLLLISFHITTSWRDFHYVSESLLYFIRILGVLVDTDLPVNRR